MTPLASTVSALQFADVFVWAICMGVALLAVGGWLSAFAFVVACATVRMVFDTRFAAPASRVRRAIGECAGFLLAWKTGQHAREHLALDRAHIDGIALALSFMLMGVVRMASTLASAVLRAAGPRRRVAWAPIPTELEPLPEAPAVLVQAIAIEAASEAEVAGEVSNDPVHARARELLARLPSSVVETLYKIRNSPDYEKLRQTWVDSEEGGLEISSATLRGLGRAPSLIVDDFKACGLILRKNPLLGPWAGTSVMKPHVVLTPEVRAILKGEVARPAV